MSKQNADDNLAGAHLDTLAIRAGIARTQEGEHSEPIFMTSSYVFKNAAEAAATTWRPMKPEAPVTKIPGNLLFILPFFYLYRHHKLIERFAQLGY